MAKKDNYFLHISLFVLTFFSCALSGVAWAGNQNWTDLSNLGEGMLYASLVIGFLTAHEFGHYFAARYHNVKVSLPYYIPMPLTFAVLSFGTLGAIIRLRESPKSNKVLFDIGVAGPIAGFLVCVVYLIYGYTHLPPIDFLYNIHPEFIKNGVPSTGNLVFGDTLLIHILQSIFTSPDDFVPPMSEIYHYPFLCAGWLGLFVTALNMIPAGQLDGGHITFAMFGKLQYKIAKIVWWIMLLLGFSALLDLAYIYLDASQLDTESIFYGKDLLIMPVLEWLKNNVPILFKGWSGWILWALITRFIIKLDHPPTSDNKRLSATRMAIGWISLIIFVLCFSPNGIYLNIQ